MVGPTVSVSQLDWHPPPLLSAIVPSLKTAVGGVLCSAYAQWHGIAQVWNELQALCGRATSPVRFFLGIGNGVTSVQAIEALLTLPNKTVLGVPGGRFHPKLYFFQLPGHAWELIEGSANLTYGGMSGNWENIVVLRSSGAPPTVVQKLLAVPAPRSFPFDHVLIKSAAQIAGQLVDEASTYRGGPHSSGRPRLASPIAGSAPYRIPPHPTRGFLLPLPPGTLNVTGLKEVLLLQLTRWDAQESYGNQVVVPMQAMDFFLPADRPTRGRYTDRRDVKWEWTGGGPTEDGYVNWNPAADGFRLSSRQLRSLAAPGDILAIGTPKVGGAYRASLVKKTSAGFNGCIALLRYKARNGKRWGQVTTR